MEPQALTPELAAKHDRLLAILRELPGVAVAFSGGIDSTIVAKAAFLALGEKAVAVTADSPSVARSELADACLSSRLAPGVAVTSERTARVEAAEAILRGLGLRECRVRYHEGDLARVEVPTGEIARLAEEPVRTELAREFRRLGFKFVT